MIEIPGNHGPTGPSGNDRRPQNDEGTNFLGWLKENKVLAGIVLAVVLVLGIFLLVDRGAEDDPTGRSGTAVDSGQVGYGDEPTETAQPGPADETPAGDPTGDESSTGEPGSTQAPAPTASPTEGGEASASPSVGVEEPEGGYQMDPEMQDPEPVAEKFSAGWMNPEGGKKAWLKRLEPTVTSYALEGLSATAESAIYDQEVSNVVIKQRQPGEYEVPFRVFGEDSEAVMDGTMIQMPDGSWKVDRILEANTLVWD